jgi:group II intron reverse transcriptase/maturase
VGKAHHKAKESRLSIEESNKEERVVDTTQQSNKDWLLDIHRKLYQWSKGNTEGAYRDLWNWVSDIRNLEIAWVRVSTNKGRATPGIDGVIVRDILRRKGAEQTYLVDLRHRLRGGIYKPQAVRRRWIPKVGKPGEKRGLGIPTIEDRIVQSAILQIIEPLFEARFLNVSHGFRPGRAVRDAIEVIRRAGGYMKKDEQGRKISPPYEWAIEGDIKGCFDNISHHAIMKRVRKTIADRKLTQLITAFLKTGIMDECNFIRTEKGTPQGGILSPLLANIALSVIEERYTRWVYP